MMFISFVLAYLIGSVSFSYLITKKIKKVDIRKEGSGNAGATNTLRVLGIGPAIGVLILDVLKGVMAILIAQALHLDLWAVALSGLCAILGHNFPVFFGFKGGKGVATTIGVFIMLLPIPFVIAGIIGLVLIAITRYVSLGSIILIILTPTLSLIIGHYSNSITAIGFLIVILAVWQHRMNIVRLFHGEENKLGHKKGV
ncbi:glycerol-3-phosphate 1-O-acyltransferase PlsY [Terrilactibacillus sp. BCM23-1]|uniref:Glycerol-3-phosphate acyltransferase n=1 Tax=Terrilactibacillus tamarindi TaxID=2599694 RepID=A0A6N8CMK4_9BACI|nr:glycerol-3-phosphate 1-O-acyltransferase PlsY [Terrilactibacillus tamarindi]MTT31262.1 glycerol-3-phosphate 1-O-acyltransferase PlsY [Terrilactibacillus tamarindi]